MKKTSFLTPLCSQVDHKAFLFLPLSSDLSDLKFKYYIYICFLNF